MIKKIIVAFPILIGIYFIISYILLNGRIYYTTSFCSKNKMDSKNRNLYLTDDLKIDYDTTNKFMQKTILENDIWVEKHYNVEYFGILFHRNVEEKNYYKLRFECKSSSNCETKVSDIVILNDTIEKSTSFPSSQIAIKIPAKVNYYVYEYKNGTAIPIGKFSVIVK